MFCASSLPIFAHANEEPEQSTPVNSSYVYETLNAELAFPWSLAFLTDNTMLVTERGGTIRHLASDGSEISQFTPPLDDLWVSGQAGLFEIALSPEFTRNGLVFLSYACGTANANNTCLARLNWDGEHLVDGQLIFRAEPEKRGSAHYGGRIAFMPDNTLLLTLGDGFDYREDAQRVSNHIGSVVRLEQDGSIPNDNPMLANSAAESAIFTYGHRNVQGIAWHPEEQRMFISEHGPRGGDEINRLRSGANYGWPLITEGLDYTGALISPYKQLPGLTAAEFSWTPSIAPSGLAIYYGDMFNEWRGDLLVPALAGKHVARLRLRESLNSVGSLSEFEAQLSGESLQKPLELEEVLFSELEARIRDIRVHPQTGALYLLTDSANGSLIKVTRSTGN
ncbi:glucose dehydrogenase [Aliidiomarina iranensis]|uniref:Glucose dehydrogenase n=2 Tax=Aliidiomarina iranensis TaxID=1434071 RepID=A0A432VUB5_9GAMM|nr:glucose dehydrogenase [Aliidiomarina iranensis]